MKVVWGRTTSICSLLMAMFSCPIAKAQDVINAGPAISGGEHEPDEGLAEIVVTAQRRAESLQDVPLSITAISGADAASLGIRSTTDIAAVAPALIFTPSVGGANVQIRGIGGTSSVGDESANAVYIDGVYQAALPALIFSLTNVERIEVLKGPQGTLYGRNSVGGVVQVVTRDPSFEPSAVLNAGYANYNTYSGSAYLTGGISNTVAADLAVQAEHQDDGWGTNLFGSVAKIVKLEHAWRRLDGRNDDGFQVAPFPG